MSLCPNCKKLGFCCFECVRLITEAETKDTRLVRIIRNSLLLLTDVYKLKPTGWVDFAHDLRRDLETTVLNYDGEKTIIDLAALEAPEELDEEEAAGLNFEEYEAALEVKVRNFDEGLRTYLDDTCCQPVPLNVTPCVHGVNRAKFIALSTLIAAAFPWLAVMWPRHVIANKDNNPTEQSDE